MNSSFVDHPSTTTNVPHSGSLTRIKLRPYDEKTKASAKASFIYAIKIRNISNQHGYQQGQDYGFNQEFTRLSQTQATSELQFSQDQYTFLEHLFEILDTESEGLVHKESLRDFVMLRCPVFRRRDADLKQYHENKSNAKTATVGFGHANPGADAYEDDDIDDAAPAFNMNEDQNEFGSPLKAEENRMPDAITIASNTFDQVWDAVISSALDYDGNKHHVYTHLGVEGWMLFSRFIALAQYHDAKRRFSARHLQTVQNKNEQENSELIIVDLPPLLEPPTPLDVTTLFEYDNAMRTKRSLSDSSSGDFGESTFLADGVDGEGIPLPELDLDHSYISIYDDSKKMKFANINTRDGINSSSGPRDSASMPLVRVSVFGSNHLNMLSNASGVSHGSNSPVGSIGGNIDSPLEFVIKFLPNGENSDLQEIVIVRRSFDDLEWLDETFKSHKPLGGTLCGRILPPFPSRLKSSSNDFGVSENLLHKRNAANSTAVAVATAGVSAGVGIVNSAAKTAKSLWGSLPGSKQLRKIVNTKATSPGVKHGQQSFPASSSYSMKSVTRNQNETPASKARQIEKYLNYILEHPALSTSFPLNLILKVSWLL